MEIVFATANKNKAAEIQKMLPDSIKVKTLEEIGCFEDIPETSETVEGNASQKTAYIVEHFNLDCFADDTALEVEALEGKPGVYSARYAGPQKSSEDNMNLLLSELEGVENRKAQFRTVISLIMDEEEKLFEGIVKGEITMSKSGNEGFGYDPIFKPEGFDRTFSEMTMDEKGEISHRGRAVSLLVEHLSNLTV